MTKKMITAVMVAVAGVASATYFDDFNDGNANGWTEVDPIGLAVGGSWATYSNPNQDYRLQAAASPNPGAAGPGRSMSFRTDFNFDDVILTWDVVDWDNAETQIFGGLARAQNIGPGTTAGYGFTYNPQSEGTGGIDLLRFDNESANGIAFTVPVSLDTAKDYRFVFTLAGASLTGEVFDIAAGGSAIATIVANDATYGSGVTGLLAANAATLGDGTADATFDNVSAIPEPATLAFVGIFGGGMLFIRRFFAM